MIGVGVLPAKQEPQPLEVCPTCLCRDIQFQSWSLCNSEPPAFVDGQECTYSWCPGCEEMGEDGTIKRTLYLTPDDPAYALAWSIPSGDWPDGLREQVEKRIAEAA